MLVESLLDDQADAMRFRWLCAHPDWHFIERLCREFVADSNMDFLTELRRVIDARRSVELGPYEHCKGSGDMKGIAGAGPDTYEVDVPCARCGGTGSEPNVHYLCGNISGCFTKPLLCDACRNAAG